MKNLFIFIKVYLMCIGVLWVFDYIGDDKGYSKFHERERQLFIDEEEERKSEAEQRIKEDYDNYYFDMQRINWEGHCRDILFDLGPPPPEYTKERCPAYLLVGKEARDIPNINPIVKIPTFEEYKKQ